MCPDGKRTGVPWGYCGGGADGLQAVSFSAALAKEEAMAANDRVLPAVALRAMARHLAVVLLRKT